MTDVTELQAALNEQLVRVREVLSANPTIWLHGSPPRQPTSQATLTSVGLANDSQWVLQSSDGSSLVSPVKHVYFASSVPHTLFTLFLYADQDAEKHLLMLVSDSLSPAAALVLRNYNRMYSALQSENNRLARQTALMKVASQIVADYDGAVQVDIAIDGRKATITMPGGHTMIVECRPPANTDQRGDTFESLYINGVSIPQE